MRFLIIAQDAGSSFHGMVYRPYYLAKYLVRCGHEVQVLAARYSHLRRQNPIGIGVERIDGIDYEWLPGLEYRSASKRAVNVLWVALYLRINAGKIAKTYRPDVVIVSSPYPFHIYGGEKIARYAGAKLIFEVRDLWPLTLTELGGISPSHPYIRWMASAEEHAYKVADKVVSVLPAADQYMKSKGMAAEKFAYIPNGVDPDEWSVEEQRLPEQLGNAIERARSKGRFIVGYLGAHGLANSLEPLVRAAARVGDLPVSVFMVGHGPEKAALKEIADQQTPVNVEFFDPIPKVCVAAFLRRIDAAYLGSLPSPLYRYGISPNKMMDYLIAGVPIIYANKAANDPVSDAQCGVSVAPANVEEIAGAMRVLASLSGEARREMGLRGREHAENVFSYPVLVKQYLELVER